MTDSIDTSTSWRDLRSEPIRITPEQDLASRRKLAGRRDFRPSGGDATRTVDGEWMWRTTLDLPEAMQLDLEALATMHGVPEDQIVREALVAFGVGHASHVVGIQDGTHSDDEPRAEVDATMGPILGRA